MKTALLCIAKNEDHYIDEWLQYHLKLGFNDIFIFQNNWRYNGNIKDNRIKIINWDNNRPDSQALSYNSFISSSISNGYDFAAFFDIDEFLTLRKHKCVNDFIAEYVDFDAVAINWRLFGDNGLTGDENIGYSCLKRFTKCEKTLNKHVKLIINLNRVDKTKQTLHSYCVHYTLKSISQNSTINVSKQHFVHGPFNETDLDKCINIAYLNHYRNKTKKEALEKSKTNTNGIFYYNKKIYIDNFESEFNAHNKNDIEDTTAKDFFFV